jgi:hypothetical protein
VRVVAVEVHVPLPTWVVGAGSSSDISSARSVGRGEAFCRVKEGKMLSSRYQKEDRGAPE